MADRFNRIDNTAPVVDVAENKKPEVQYSNFDLTCKEVGQAIPYALIPIDVIEMFPNSDVDLNYDLQVTFRNPTMRRILNGFRVYLHAYYNRCSDLWEGWNNFITRGRSGTESGGGQGLEIPYLQTRLKDTSNNSVISPFTPMSLYDYLGYTPEVILKESGVTKLNKYTGIKPADVGNDTLTGLADYTNLKINALKAMMYQKIWRDKYSPKNLLQNNSKIFPKNEDHFIISYNATKVGKIDYGNEEHTSTGYKTSWGAKSEYVMDSNSNMRIDCLRFRQFQGDRFTTASPFSDMIRGNAPYLTLNVDPNSLKITIPETDIESGIYYQYLGNPDSRAEASILAVKEVNSNLQLATGDNSQYIGIIGSKLGQPVYDNGAIKAMGSFPEKEIAVKGTSITSEIKLKDLRSLEVFTIFAERMARCDGNYNSLVKAQFGYNPKAENREAIYIGGSYQDIALNSIYQTSETDGTNRLGQSVAMGNSASYNKLGSFHSDDYGYVMVIMSIVPETIYTTGISKKDTAITFEDQYWPIMNNLSAEPILNKELFVSGTEATDEDLYGYAERYSEYKSRRNKAKGFSQLPSTIDAYDAALIMARKFSTTPALNANMVTGYPDAYSLESFSSTEEPPFDYAVIKDVRARYPMPYVTIPEGLGIA